VVLHNHRMEEGVKSQNDIPVTWVEHTLGLLDNLIDFTTDTNRVVAQMHYTNRSARTPKVRYTLLPRRRIDTPTWQHASQSLTK
jgi:hypothetical protein